MAPDVTVEIRHAVYDTYSHQHGPELFVDPARLETLLSQGDAALDRGAGRFFEVIEDDLVVVFSENRTEGTRGRMRYFDVFTLPVESTDSGVIAHLVNGLEECRVLQYDDEPVSPVTVTLAQKSEQANHDSNEEDSTPNNQTSDPHKSQKDTPVDNTQETSKQYSTSGQDQTIPQSAINERFIAEVWEQIRRDTVQCEATLDEVGKFFACVDGALTECSFVSRCREDVGYFDISGETELAMDTHPEEIVDLIGNLLAENNLRYGALPTYREELEQKRKQERQAIRNDDRISKTTETVIWEFYKKIESQLQEYPELAAQLMREVENGTLSEDEDDDGGLKSRFSGLMGSNEDGVETTLIHPADYPNIDDEAIISVDSKLDEKRKQINQDIKEQLLSDLQNELLTEINKQTEHVAEKSMSAIQDTRTSELHEWAKNTNSDY